MALNNIATAALEAKVTQKGLSWQQICEVVVELHGRYAAARSGTTFETTGRRLGYHDGSTVAKYHRVWEHFHLTEVRTSRTLREAYAIVQATTNAHRKIVAKEWLDRRRMSPRNAPHRN